MTVISSIILLITNLYVFLILSLILIYLLVYSQYFFDIELLQVQLANYSNILMDDKPRDKCEYICRGG